MRFKNITKMMFILSFLVSFVTLCVFSGLAASVYLLRGGDASSDSAVVAALTNGGHEVTEGVVSHLWNGTQADLNNFDAVVLLNNFNWDSGSISNEGVAALLNFLDGRGGIVTGEWLIWNINRGVHPGLGDAMPVTGGPFNSAANTTYTQQDLDKVINEGLPTSFSIALRDFAGTESAFTARDGAFVFYSSSNGGGIANSPGLAGWNFSNGRVISFSTLISDTELASDDYKQVLVNAVNWAARPAK